MSVQSISAASDPTIPQDYSTAQPEWIRLNQTGYQMGEALKNGDLAQAQADYSVVMKTAPAFIQNGQGPMGQALANLGSALQSGSLSSAQKAFQFLAQHLSHRRHVAPKGSASPDATAGSTSDASRTPSRGNVLDVQG